ncbi:MAG: hypothetical protein KGZ82_03135 [Bacteroidales bacterium]|nr:hypothetical protein [Bacteroidales bacterium]
MLLLFDSLTGFLETYWYIVACLLMMGLVMFLFYVHRRNNKRKFFELEQKIYDHAENVHKQLENKLINLQEEFRGKFENLSFPEQAMNQAPARHAVQPGEIDTSRYLEQLDVFKRGLYEYLNALSARIKATEEHLNLIINHIEELTEDDSPEQTEESAKANMVESKAEKPRQTPYANTSVQPLAEYKSPGMQAEPPPQPNETAAVEITVEKDDQKTEDGTAEMEVERPVIAVQTPEIVSPGYAKIEDVKPEIQFEAITEKEMAENYFDEIEQTTKVDQEIEPEINRPDNAETEAVLPVMPETVPDSTEILPESTEAPADHDAAETIEEGIPGVFYFSIPDGQGFFEDASKNAIQTEASLYKIEMDPSAPELASLTFVAKNETFIRDIITHADTWLKPVCSIQSLRNSGTRLTVIQKGIVQLSDGRWQVREDARLKLLMF